MPPRDATPGEGTLRKPIEDLRPGDYLRAVEDGETALHVYLKDDKEWWIAYNPDGEYPGSYNGPWLLWATYPSGPWQLTMNTRGIMHHHVDELYYIDYYGDEAHSVHELTTVPISDAPEFVRKEVDG